MKTKKNYNKPVAIIERFRANEYVASCQYVPSPDMPANNKFPSNTFMYIDGVVDKKLNESFHNGKLDPEEKNKSVTTNSSDQSEAFDGIRKAWLVEGLVEIEVGFMQHQGMGAAYVKGSLVHNAS